ncbi:LLM class flavin-dependent oxidoreductase [Arenibaculum sp.]|uniref:LLM class flavin-dependent oxidoreductase n=1 Tax=Arenibaculum sp. TaxID=2865862 RepID=UPI002E11ECF9|nr:LLM class flavin-dependent oxidoreductase [Arenibaculum sp.]
MTDMTAKREIRIIGSTPTRTAGETGERFIGRFNAAVGWADRAGWTSALIYTSNNALDPWLLAQLLVLNTGSLRPLVAIQPIYSHPFTVANQLASLAALHGRGVDLNFVAGDHPRDRESLNDAVPHDERYARLGEYGRIVKELLGSPRPVSFAGRYYAVKNLQLVQRPSASIRTGFLMSGSSEAARDVARALGACAIQYPEAPGAASHRATEPGLERGVRLGIIARSTDAEAWDVANRRFPADPDGAAIREYASGVSDSRWVKTLLDASAQIRSGVYWLGPFKHFQRSCPYLVGSHAAVGAVLADYVSAGYRTFLIDSLETEEEAHAITDLFGAIRRGEEDGEGPDVDIGGKGGN